MEFQHPTGVRKRFRWDDVLALGYAAEQLFVAGQLLTSDVVPVDEAVHVACERHIGGLLRVKHLLPRDLVRELELCANQCPTAANLTREEAEQLGRRVLAILENLRCVLNAIAEQRSGGDFLNAA